MDINTDNYIIKKEEKKERERERERKRERECYQYIVPL